MNETFDFVAVGSDGGSMCAALVMRAEGRSVLILEKTALVGGTTATSGGVMWIPNNRFMRSEGIEDSREQAATYLDAVVGDSEDTPGASRERRLAYIDAAPQMVDFLVDQGIRLRRIPSWPDYKEAPGESVPGRTVVAELFDLNQLGEWKSRLRPGFIPLPANLDEAMQLPNIKRSWSARKTLAKVIGRTLVSRLTGKHLVTAGQALQGQMLKAALEAGAEIRTDTGVKQLLVDNGRVTGVVVEKDGADYHIGARLGVLINAGGFARNQSMLDRHIPGTSAEWSNTTPGDTGEMIEEGIRIGAAIAQMEERIGFPVSLLAGCTVVLKAAPDTPAMSAIMGELAAEAGFPAGVFNVITSADPAMAGEMLVTDPRVDMISFTGSTAVGKRIMEKGAATLKRLALELGGKSANIILDDAPEFGRTVAGSMVVFHAGQGCATPTRLLVPRSRYEESLKALEMAYAGFADKWGDFDDPTQVMGPVISARQRDRVMSYIELGQREGARLLAGGNTRSDKGGGFFIEPTGFVDVSNDMRIAREEIFGPVLVVIPYEDDEDAIRIANDSGYGLGGSVISADRERALRVARRMRTGAISVNGGMSITGDLPFGGFKGSGMGREWGREGIEEFLYTKAIAVRV